MVFLWSIFNLSFNFQSAESQAVAKSLTDEDGTSMTKRSAYDAACHNGETELCASAVSIYTWAWKNT